MKKNLLLIAGLAATAMPGFVCSVHADICVVPPPPSGHQAKVSSVIDLHANRAVEPFRTDLSDAGSGYPPGVDLPVTAISSAGSGAKFTARAGGGGSILFVTSQDANGSSHTGAGYADDLTLVIAPPHTNDFGAYLNNAACDTLELQAGTYYQNAVIDRDVIIRGQGIGRTIVSGGLRDSVFKILPGRTVHLQDMTITDGLALNGGGIFNDGSQLVLERVEIKNCRAYGPAGEGGGIYNKGAAVLTLNDCVIHYNAAARNGGGISNSGINTSFLPVAAGSHQRASLTLEQLFTGFIELPGTENLDETNPSSAEQFDLILDQFNTFLGNAVNNIGDIPTLFDSAVGDGFGASGWSGIGSPTTKINRSTIARNKTGIGIANSQTYLLASLPVISGQSYTALGVPIPIISHFELQELHPNDVRLGGWGGGIHNDLGLLMVQDSFIEHNEVHTRLASFGGGISSFLGAVLVTNTTMTFNRSEVTTVLPSGGAIHSFASLVRVTDSKLNNNTVKAGLFMSSGGAIKNTGLSFTELSRCELNNNISGGGGGAANDYLARLNMTDCTIRSNFVSGIIGAEGGGVRNAEGGILNLDNCSVVDNRGEGKAKGGGVFNHCQQVRIGPAEFPIIPIAVTKATVRNCTISGNSLQGTGIAGIPLEARGGGIYNGSFDLGIATVDIFSSTICSNSAVGGVFHTGGGVWNTALASFKLKPLANIPGLSITKVANNLFVGNVPTDVDTSFLPLVSFISSDGYNMDSDGSGRAEASGFATANNHLTPLMNNGGPTPTHALLPGSAAINAGSPDGALDETRAPAADQRGLVRSLGGRRDVGAFETAPPVSFPDAYTTFEDQPLVIPASAGVFANDFGTSLSVSVFHFDQWGSGFMGTDGSLTFTPAPNFNGSFNVPYVANDAFQQGGNTSVCAIVVKPRLDLVAMNPAPNSVVTNRAAPVVLTFDEPVSVGAAAKIVLEGSLGGPMSFTASSAGNVVTLHPSRPFQPGETVSIRVGTNVQSVAGSPVVPAIRRQFFVGVMNGGAVFIPGQNLGAAGANPINYLGANKLVLLDMDRDGDLDIVGTELGNGVWRNGGQGNFTPVGQTLTCPGASTPASGIDVADLNGDGLPDVFLVTDHPLAKNCVWLNNGNGTFSRSPNTIVLKATRSLPGIERFAPAKDVALGDLNGDGHPDAFITASSVFSTGNQVWLNDGRGNFTRSVASGIQFGGNAVRLADLNGDGFLDAVVAYDELAESGFRAVRVWLNDGAGRFASTGQDFGIPRSDLVILGDVNRDGTIDAVITSSTLFSGSTPRVWLNDGTGQFAAGQQLASGHFVSAVMADLNADGSLDLALASEYDDNEVWLNDGNGNFNQSSEYTGNASTGLSAGDVNGDGAVDLLASGFDNQVFINVRRPSAGMPPSFTINENETLRFSLPNTLLSSASSPIGGVLKVVTNQTVQFRNTLGMIWFTFGFDVDPVYEGIWPDGSYVHTYVTRVFANHGTLLLEPDGTFTYQPDPYYFGPDSFTYQVNDGLADSLPVTVNITVNRVPQVPVANRDWYTKFDSTFKVGLGTSFFVERNAGGGVLANDIDFHSEPLTAVLDSPPAHGSLIFNPDGSFRYVPSSPTFTPYPGPPGLDQFTYHVTNGYYASTPTVVSIGYAAPVAFPDEYALVPDQPLVVDAAQGVLANDSDPNLSADPNLKVFAVLRDRPSHGQVQLDASGSFTYTPNPGYTGGDVFTYTAHDSLAGSGLARVKLGNTPPIALDDTDYLTFNGKALTVTAAQGVLANDSDPDGDSITSILVSDVSHGALQLNHDGSFTYTPSSDHSGLDSFTYRASDGRTNSTTRTATIRTANLLGVVSVSPPPNGLNASTNTEVEFTFNSPLVASTIPGRVTVNGSLTGRRAFSTSISGLQLRLHLDVPLLPGELVTVNLEKGIQGANFYDLERAYTSQFQTVAPRGGAIFTRTVAGTTTTNFSRSVVLGDLNADGFPDAFIANRYRLPTLLINNRDRTFAERDESLGLQYPQLHDIAPILADFNGDGLPDLAAAGRVDSIFGLTSAIAVGLNDGTGHFPNTRTLPLNGSSGTVLPNVMLAADCDGDGDVDIVGASFDRAAVWHNDGAGNFTLDESSFAPIPSGMQGGAIGDVNNDGHLDVYLVGFNGDKLLINDGTGQFAASNQILNTNYATQVVLTDLDGDGSLDAVLAAQYPIGNQIWLNDGSGHFRRSLHELTLSTTIALAVGDLNADGNPDLWQANTRDGLGGGGGDSVWTSDGAARFSRFGPLLGTSSSQGVATADLDGDADLDVFVVSDGSESGSPGSGNEVWFNQSVPFARDDYYSANGSSPVVVAASGVIANDIAGDNGSIAAVLATPPARGGVILNPDGGFIYTPGHGFAGTDVFTYRVQDGSTSSAPARVKIGNTSPAASDDGPLRVVNDSPFKLAAPGVLGNDSDGEGDPLRALLVAPPSNGSLVFRANGSFIYTANSGFAGPDSFTYRVTDGLSTSSVATVSLDVRASLRVLAVAPAPDSVSIPANTSIEIEFDHPLSEGSIGSKVAVIGSFTGPRAYTHALSGNHLRLTPLQPFMASEQVTLQIADTLQGGSGESLLHGFQARFVAEAPTGGGTFQDSGQRLGDTNYNSSGIVLGDLNGDGSLDALIPNRAAIVVPVFIPGKAHVWTNNGSGVFVDTGRVLGTNSSSQAVLGDLNGDGTLDAVYRFVRESGGGVEIWLNDGTSHFSRSTEEFGTNSVSALALADLNGDGPLDLVVLGSAELRIFLNDGAGHFTENPASVENLSFNNQTFAAVAATDLNGDGTTDLVLQDFFSSKSPRVLLNDGRGILSDTGQSFGGGSSMAVGDLNGDGFPDLFLPAAGSSYLWLNNGTGFFTDSGKVYPNLSVRDVRLADVNGDRTLDAIVIQHNGSGFPLTNLSTIYLNDGAGNFTDSHTRFDDLGLNAGGSANIPASTTVGDVNGDGAPDLFVGGGSRLPNQVWLNRPRLADPSGMRTITIDDTQTTSPFDQIVLKGAGVLSVKVALDDAAKGDFVPATLASGGFSDPVDGWYSSTPGSTASAQAALRQLVFAPARNRVPVGSTEVTTFTLVISDETNSNTNRESVVISISANDPPVAGHDVGAGFTTTELESFTMADVLGNDVDPDPADSLSVVGLTPLDALGSIADLGNGVFRYDPGGKFNSLPAGQSATDAFAYIVQDANGGTASGLVTITIIGVNQPPVASDAVVTVNENSGANVITPLLLAGATDPDAGDKANLTIATIDAFGTHGQVQLLTGDVLLYSPDGAFPNLPAGATASDSFGFTITDGHGGFSTARANITVVGVNDPPAAGMASFTISEHSGQTNITAGLFAAASDADPGETATLRLVAIDPSAAIGSVTFSNGIVTYSPAGQLRNLAQGQIGVDTLSYSVQDAQGDLSIGVAQVNIVGENDPPLPTPAFITVEDGSGPVDLTSALLAPVIDPDQGETATLRISALVETNLSAGPVLLESGIVTYRPPSLRLPAGQFVTNGFSYAVTDVHGASSNGVCVIYIVGVNTPPVADPAQFSLNEDQVLEGIVTGTDADGDSLAFSLVTGPVHGALVLETNGVFRFTPPADFSGAESFSFVANDGQMDSEPATVSFSILPVNDPPSFVPGTDQTVAEDAGAQVVQTWATAIRTGPADEADQALLFLLEADNPLLFADQPALDAEGTLTFTPAPNAHGSALVTVVLTDDGGTVHGGQDTSASQSFRITVTPVNDPPTLVLDTASRTVQHSDPVAPVTVAAQDVDSPGANLALAVSWNFNGGTFMSGLPPGLTLTQGTILDQQRTWTLAGEAQAPPGVFKVRFMVTDDGDLQGAGDLDVVVEPEDARATFTGTLFASTAAINSGAATVTLAATIRDITAVPGDPAHDPVAGDIRNARVTFINRDNNAILASNLPVGLVAANDPTTGTVVFDWNVDLGAATSQSFTIGTVVHGHHTRDSAEENTVVTVSRPLATDFASGGGSLVLVRPAGLVPGGIGTKMNFGFNVKYKKKGQGLQGNINIIVRNDGRVYEIKGTTMTSLSVSGSRATFNGRAGIQDITNPEAPVGIDGDATLQIKMTDFGEPGSSDSIGVTVWNAEGGLWFASHWDGIRTVEQTIAGGNLVVRSGAAKGGAAPATMAGSGSSFGSDAPSLSISRVVATDELDGFREASPEMNCIQFQAVIGADYAVERSIDLHQWTHLATVTTYTGEIMFFDDTACPENRRFYRVRRLTPPTKGSDPVLLQGATDATTGPTWPPADKPAS